MKSMITALFLGCVLVCCGVGVAETTAQLKDKIVWEGQVYSIDQYPLEKYLNTLEPRPAFWSPAHRSSNQKGYIAGWQIINNELWLVVFKVEHSPVDIAAIFPGKKLPIKATWYSGDVVVNTGGTTGLVYQNGQFAGVRGSSEVMVLKIMDGVVLASERKSREVRDPASVGIK